MKEAIEQTKRGILGGFLALEKDMIQRLMRFKTPKPPKFKAMKAMKKPKKAMKKPKKATKQPKKAMKAMKAKSPKFNRKEYMRNYHAGLRRRRVNDGLRRRVPLGLPLGMLSGSSRPAGSHCRVCQLPFRRACGRFILSCWASTHPARRSRGPQRGGPPLSGGAAGLPAAAAVADSV